MSTPTSEKHLSEIAGSLSWHSLFLCLLALNTCSLNNLEDYDESKVRCQEKANVLYTNVGTPIIGRDGKPIPCN